MFEFGEKSPLGDLGVLTPFYANPSDDGRNTKNQYFGKVPFGSDSPIMGK